MCIALPRRFLSEKFLLLGSVSCDGIRPADLSGKPPRHRDVPAFDARQLYHMGFRGRVARSTLADANESRDWRIYADFAQVLIGMAWHGRYMPTTRSVWTWSRLCTLSTRQQSTSACRCFRGRDSASKRPAVKMHTLLDLHGNIPTFIRITGGKVHDINILDEIGPEAGAFYVMDRAYVDFERLFVFTLCSSFFVVRTKKNILLQRRYSHPVDKSTGLRSDQTVILAAIESAQAYPDPLRRVSYFDARTNKRLKFLTNNFAAPGADHRPHLQVALAD